MVVVDISICCFAGQSFCIFDDWEKTLPGCELVVRVFVLGLVLLFTPRALRF